MADDTSASVISLHQVPQKRKAKTSAERAKAYRQRKKKTSAAAAAPPSSEHLVPLDFPLADSANATVTLHPVAPLRRSIAPVLLSTAALALAGVGITMNGWFARSLGSTDAAGWLFLAVGVAADLVALVIPSCERVFGGLVIGQPPLPGGSCGL